MLVSSVGVVAPLKIPATLPTVPTMSDELSNPTHFTTLGSAHLVAKSWAPTGGGGGGGGEPPPEPPPDPEPPPLLPPLLLYDVPDVPPTPAPPQALSKIASGKSNHKNP